MLYLFSYIFPAYIRIFRYLDSYGLIGRKGFGQKGPTTFFLRRPPEHSGFALAVLVLWRAWSISSCNMAAGFQTTFRRSSNAAT